MLKTVHSALSLAAGMATRTVRSTAVSSVAADGTTLHDWQVSAQTLADTAGGRKDSTAGGSCEACC